MQNNLCIYIRIISLYLLNHLVLHLQPFAHSPCLPRKQEHSRRVTPQLTHARGVHCAPCTVLRVHRCVVRAGCRGYCMARAVCCACMGLCVHRIVRARCCGCVVVLRVYRAAGIVLRVHRAAGIVLRVHWILRVSVRVLYGACIGLCVYWVLRALGCSKGHAYARPMRSL